jgi:hypothetical protein
MRDIQQRELGQRATGNVRGSTAPCRDALSQ